MEFVTLTILKFCTFQVISTESNTMENTNNPVSGSQNSASYKTQTTISEMYFEIFMLYRRQWLTYAFQSVITTGINIHVQEPD